MDVRSTASKAEPLLSWLSAPHWLFGPLITLAVAVLIELLDHQHGIPVAAPPAVLVLCIAYTAATSGTRAGLLSAAIAWLFLAHYYAIPGEPFRYTERRLIYILLWAVTAPAMAVIIGRLGRRAGLATELEHTLAERERAEGTAARFGRILEYSSNEIYVADARTMRFVLVNEGARHNLGYRMDELVAMSPLDLESEEDRSHIEAQLAPLRAGRTDKLTLETVHRRKDGSTYPVELQIQYFAEERPPVFVSFGRDLTYRKQAEEALRESEERFRATFEQAAVGIAHVSPEGRFLRVNQRFCDIVGYTRAEMLACTFQDITHPDDLEVDLEYVRQVLNGGIQTYSMEKRYIRKDSSVVWVNLTVALVRDPVGAPDYFISVVEDISERRRAEEESHLLQSTTTAVGEAPDLNAALEVVLRKVCAATGWVYGEVWLPCEQDEKLQCGQVFYSREADLKDFALRSHDYRFARGEGLPGRVWASRRPVWIPDVTQDANFPRAPLAEKASLHASMGIPVLAGEEVVAILAFFVHESRPEDERLMEVVSGAAAQLGQVIRRKRAEEALRENEARLEHAQRTAHLGSWEWDIASGALYWSDEMFRVFGHVRGRFVPRYEGFLESVHPDDRAFVLDALRKTLEEGQPYRIDFRIVRPDGTSRVLHTEAEVLRGAEGRPQRLNGISLDVTEMRQAQERLSYLAHFDVLTGLPNRALLDDRLQQAMHEADRRERLVGVLFLDLDRFKNINDSLGHLAGDELLKAVAGRLLEAVRKGDTVARLSGDEFTVVLADMAHVDDAARVARKVLEVFGRPFRVAGRELYVTASVGITLYPLDDKEPQALLRDADVAMYRAKETGRNTYQFYSADMTAKAAERLALESALRRAIELDELFLEYQPIVDCGNGAIVGAEALLRWRHRRRGLIMPGEFIPLAEETGIIVSLGEWVLRRACTQARAWRDAGFSSLRVAVNLSPRQFQQPDLAATVFRILEETGADPACLDLEITEGAIMQQPEISIETLRRLSERGIALSVDDFGTGYSSLSYLKRFPINHLKIDQSFVRDITTDPNDAALVNAIITMAKSLDIGVIAEGVESKAQLDYLHAHGCEVAQGYLFSRPVSADDFGGLLRAGMPLPGDTG